MYNRMELKTRARSSLRRHRMIWILICIIGLILAGESVFPKFGSEDPDTVGRGSAATGLSDLSDRISDILIDMGEDRLEERREQMSLDIQEIKTVSEDNRIFGRSRGVLSDLVNRITSGSFILILGSGIQSIVGSASISLIILIFLSLILLLAVWIFILNPYQIIRSRMFLEGRCYEKIHITRLLYLFKSGYWVRASMAILRKEVYQLLWNLTVVGGIIKHYSYYLVPYILAENPAVSGREAVTMSRRMMHGHKWQCFVLELSFIGWELLDLLTLGILRIVFVLPYEKATYCEYYVYLREIAKTEGIEGTQMLNDVCLYEHASEEALKGAYGDVISVLETAAKEEGEPLRGIYRLLAKYAGVTIRNRRAEQHFSHQQAAEYSVYMIREELDQKVYPQRLNGVLKPGKEYSENSVSALRTYSIWSILMIYITASVIGWLWEVSLHLISDGTFVNRGVLHGPWLPIYGTGCVLILVLLYRFRKNPVTEFIATIIVCGVVEYSTAYYLEMAHDGKKWWDYTGYFLNLHGRICAEGLLVFGIGGLAIVYLLAPILDNLFRKIRQQYLIALCLVLLIIFGADNIYSSKHPNEGEGITSYTASEVVAGAPFDVQ